jgi:F-type H+-transporting ATPase subunit gamma
MASLKDLRNRISSVKATQKITKAMQMVAAAKLKKAQSAAEQARPYSNKMAEVLAGLAKAMGDREDAPTLLAGNGRDQVYLLVVCTAERGLCGGFNSSIARKAKDHARRLMNEGKEVKIYTVGKKGYDALKMDFGKYIVERVDFRNVRNLSFEEADQVGKRIIEMFEEEAFDVCTLFYSEFQSVISQVPTAHQLIPASFEEVEESDDEAEAAGMVYDYEPSEEAILNDLLPRNISVQVFRALLENAASEQGARMTAMDNATRNAGEMIDNLTLDYNRQRQAQITKELIEIISGAEAL